MKTKLTLILALLAFCVSGVRADETITLMNVNADTPISWTNTADFYDHNSGSDWYAWLITKNAPKLRLVCTNANRFISANGKQLANCEYLMMMPYGYNITGYTIKFTSSDANTATVTGWDNFRTEKDKQASTSTTDVKTLSVSGLSTQVVEFKVADKYINIQEFSVTYASNGRTAPFTQGAKYRIKGSWKSFYLYGDKDDNKELKKGTALPITLMTNANYIWAASMWNGSDLQLQNVASSCYIKKIQTSDGNSEKLLTATTADIETFLLVDRNSYATGAISLFSKSHIERSNATPRYAFLNQYSGTTDTYVGRYSAYHEGDAFIFSRVKTVTFSSAVAVNGGDAVSTIYVATDGSDSFTLPEGYKYTFGGKSYSAAKAAAELKKAGTDDISVNVTALPAAVTLENDKLYRIQQTWTQGGGTNFYYLYANTSDATNGDRLWKDAVSSGSLTIPTKLLTNANYVWQAKSNSTNWQFFNPAADNGNGRYIAKAPENNASISGSKVNCLEATTAGTAESFTIEVAPSDATYEPVDFVTYRYLTLKATSHTGTYLNSYGIGSPHTNFVGWHTVTHYGYYFRFVPVKTVTFSSDVAVNNGDGVSTIYVAQDGSDTFTLPDGYAYYVSGIWMNNTAAATAIAATGTSDITVTVTDNFSINLNSDGAVTPTYYATLYLPFDVTITGADAFTLYKSGNYLVPTEVEDNKVPAGTPVLLKGTNATATATINTGDAFNSGTPLSCALTGTYVDKSVAKTDGLSNDYYLGIKNSKVGFYKWNGTTLKANRAYLTAATASQVKEFLLNFDEDGVTGIVSSLGDTDDSASIYNLAGQRVSKAQKGIYIVNGKKVLF
ncbi:MAG: hypothetical protein J5524_06550 [Bacteroidaceae bacterium]|nr:hypothetical protein [Bacteroidaceae bacterium]